MISYLIGNSMTQSVSCKTSAKRSLTVLVYAFVMMLSGIAQTSPKEGAMLLFEFGPETDFDAWRTINDGVMGGVSKSVFMPESDSVAVFKGTVSPENNGGFASVRTSLTNRLSPECGTFVVRVLGDGKTYSLRCRTEERLSGIAYDAPFTTKKGEWTEHHFEIDEFSPVFRGRPVPDAPSLRPKDIRQIGFLIAQKQFGDFELRIDFIRCMPRTSGNTK